MSPRISRDSSLDDLKKEAKRWLKVLQSGDADARARLTRAVPSAPEHVTLRTVQLALARELGFSGWAALKAHAESASESRADRTELIDRFLDNACPDHHVRGGPDHVRARHTALRILERHPDIATASFYTAVVCGDVARVRGMLAERPELAATAAPGRSPYPREGDGGSGDLYRVTGPKGWEPLLYLCFTRLPLPAVDRSAVEIAALLLDHGADPNAFFKAGGSRYTPLVGAAGEGEESRPPHSRRDELVALLLTRGAEPYDTQVIYNLFFRGQVLWFLKAMHQRSLELGRSADWDDPEWSMIAMGGYGSGARWHLNIAVRENDLELARWCLQHGANPNSAPPRDARQWQGTLYEDAVRRGHVELAELLARHGAVRSVVAPTPEETFTAACLRMDREEVRAQIAADPSLLTSTAALFAAADADRDDVVGMLLDLGMSPDVRNAENERALHMAGYRNSLRVAELLVSRGAEIDPVESNWGNTPLGAAVYAGHAEMIALLARYSRDVWRLTYTGSIERLRLVLEEKPARARVMSENRHTPLMWLPPDDERTAMQAVELLLAHGADAAVRNDEGMTAADRAERIGMFDVARRLAAAGGEPAAPA